MLPSSEPLACFDQDIEFQALSYIRRPLALGMAGPVAHDPNIELRTEGRPTSVASVSPCQVPRSRALGQLAMRATEAAPVVGCWVRQGHAPLSMSVRRCAAARRAREDEDCLLSDDARAKRCAKSAEKSRAQQLREQAIDFGGGGVQLCAPLSARSRAARERPLTSGEEGRLSEIRPQECALKERGSMAAHCELSNGPWPFWLKASPRQKRPVPCVRVRALAVGHAAGVLRVAVAAAISAGVVAATAARWRLRSSAAHDARHRRLLPVLPTPRRRVSSPLSAAVAHEPPVPPTPRARNASTTSGSGPHH